MPKGQIDVSLRVVGSKGKELKRIQSLSALIWFILNQVPARYISPAFAARKERHSRYVRPDFHDLERI